MPSNSRACVPYFRESDVKANVARQPGHSVYQSAVPFDTNRIQAVVIYCSDGRFGEQIDEFLQQKLQLPRYNRLAVPGGPACLAEHCSAYRHDEGVMEFLKFLISVHQIRRVVLIAHQNCAFYLDYLKVHSIDILERQRDDLRRAVRRVQTIAPNAVVESYFARLEDDQVSFQTLDQMNRNGNAD